MKTHPYLEELAHSATLHINEMSVVRINAGQKVYRWGFGQSPFPVPQIMVEALRRFAPEKNYLEVQGLEVLREKIATYTADKIGCSYQAENIIVGPGSKQLIFQLLMSLEGPLLLPTPSWVSYGPQARLLHKKIIKVPSEADHDYKITPAQLSNACSAHAASQYMLILNAPNNPVGNCYSAIELQALAKVAASYNIIIISDEIYSDLSFTENYHSIASFYDRTIVTSGISKWVGAGGWRLGYCCINPTMQHLVKLINKISSETFTSVSAPIQYAAIPAFERNPEIVAFKKQSISILRTIGNYVHQSLAEMNIESPKPQGGFYLFIDFKYYRHKLFKHGIKTSKMLCDTLLDQTGIALLPGSVFFRAPSELTARLAYVDFDGQQVLNVENTLDQSVSDEEYVQLIAPKMIEGLNVLRTWLNNL